MCFDILNCFIMHCDRTDKQMDRTSLSNSVLVQSYTRAKNQTELCMCMFLYVVCCCYSLLVKRTPLSSGYCPDCKCSFYQLCIILAELLFLLASVDLYWLINWLLSCCEFIVLAKFVDGQQCQKRYAIPISDLVWRCHTKQMKFGQLILRKIVKLLPPDIRF